MGTDGVLLVALGVLAGIYAIYWWDARSAGRGAVPAETRERGPR